MTGTMLDAWTGQYSGDGRWRDSAGNEGGYRMRISVSVLPGDGLQLDTQGRYELPGGGAAEDSASVLLTRDAGAPEGVYELRSGQSSGRAFRVGDLRLVLCYEAEVRGQKERIVETFVRDGRRIERAVVIEQAQRCLSTQDVLDRED